MHRLSARHCSSRRCPGDPIDVTADQSLDDATQNDVTVGQWVFSRAALRTSLLAGLGSELEDIAVRMFNSALVYTELETSGLYHVH